MTGEFKVGLDEGLFKEFIADLEAKPADIARAARRAVGAGASAFRGILANVVNQNALGWAPLHPITKIIPKNPPMSVAQGGRRGTIGRQKAEGKFLGKLARVFRYDLSPEGETPWAVAGILDAFSSTKSRGYFEAFQAGGPANMTFSRANPKPGSMNRYWQALGFGISGGKTPNRPARPLVEPAWDKYNEGIQKLMFLKFSERLSNPK